MPQLGNIFAYNKNIYTKPNINDNVNIVRHYNIIKNFNISKYFDVNLGTFNLSDYISLPANIPNTPTKGTYNSDATTYAVILINNFLYKLKEPLSSMDIPGFNILSTKYYKYSKDIKPIAFSRISDDNTTIIICFRGSQTIIDYIEDTKYNYYNPVNGVLPVESNPETKVYTHPGYTSIYTENGIRGDILSNINTHIKNNPNKLSRIFICGHSLGASLSFLLANELGGLYTNMVEVYGIAPPKTGDNPFSNSVQNNCKYALSLINLADMVPSLITTYMHNKNNPKIPCSFSHIEPIAIFNNIQSSTQNCHLIDAYYEGITIGNPGIVSNIITS